MEHQLKIWPEYYTAMMFGSKSLEVRKNDREYKISDYLFLREWDPKTKNYTGRVLARMVINILYGGQFGIEKGYVVMSLQVV